MRGDQKSKHVQNVLPMRLEMQTNVSLNPACINSNTKVVIVKPKHLKSHALHLRNYLIDGHIIVVKNLNFQTNHGFTKNELKVEYNPIDIKDSINSNKRDLSHHKIKKLI